MRLQATSTYDAPARTQDDKRKNEINRSETTQKRWSRVRAERNDEWCLRWVKELFAQVKETEVELSVSNEKIEPLIRIDHLDDEFLTHIEY